MGHGWILGRRIGKCSCATGSFKAFKDVCPQVLSAIGTAIEVSLE